jgi:hypothetical protein
VESFAEERVLKIQGAFGFLDCPPGDAGGVNHRGPHIIIPEQGLDSPYIVIGLEEMGGKALVWIGRGMGSIF